EQVARSGQKMMPFVSSRMGSIALHNSGASYAYRSSKAALNTMVKTLSVDLGPRGICALALHPGWAATEPRGRAPWAGGACGRRPCRGKDATLDDAVVMRDDPKVPADGGEDQRRWHEHEPVQQQSLPSRPR